MSDILVKTTDLPWVPLAEGIDYRVLRTSAETGTWTVLLRAQAGSSFAKHRHLGPGEYFMVKGRMEYRAGSAVAGDYGCEPLDAVHEETNFPVYSELYFTNHGPVVFLDDDDNVTSILDHRVLTQLAAAHSSEAKTASGRKSKQKADW
ncbi:MAG: 2,4'-dihydroxyacetophenone dioxygenase family protein [Pseudomonadota bacterium]|nr:2,4'-dihydroxyacetophenone dioxygenase family protein [Pseudomonadota bacterium]